MKEINIKITSEEVGLDSQQILKNQEEILSLLRKIGVCKYVAPELPPINPPVDPVDPVDPPVIAPPTNPDFIYLEDISSDMNEAWRIAVQQKGKYIKLKDNKTYKIDSYETVDPLALGVIGNLNKSKSPTLEIGSWTKPCPNKLFFFRRSHAEFGFVGVNICQPKGTPKTTILKEKYLFDGELDVLKTAKLAVIGSHNLDKDQMGWAITELIYSSGDGSEGFIDIIVKDCLYNGTNFTQLKCSRGQNMRESLLDVEIHNPIIEPPRTHYYNPTSFVIPIRKEGNKLYATNGDFNKIKTHYGFEDIGVRSIVNIDRFVFNISDDSVALDGNTLTINPATIGVPYLCYKYDNISEDKKNKTFATNAEFQPGDITSLGKIVEKQIQNSAIPGVSEWQKWAYVLDRNLPSAVNSVTLISTDFNIPNGNIEAMIAYKYKAAFSSPFLTEKSFFNQFELRQSGGIGWSKYDHREVNRFWKNVKFTGFMRDSTARQDFDTIGYNWENVVFVDGVGQITKREPFNDVVIFPEIVVNYINKLESLAK